MTYATVQDLVARFGLDEMKALDPEPQAAILEAGNTEGSALEPIYWDYLFIRGGGKNGMRRATVDPADPRRGDAGESVAAAAAILWPRTSAVLMDAAAEIDGVLAHTYALPLPSGTYPLLVPIACDIARHRLYDDAEPEDVSERAMRARSKLQAIAGGKYALVASTGARVARRTSARSVGPDPAMTRTALEGF